MSVLQSYHLVMLLRVLRYCHTEWGTVCRVSAWKSTIGPSCGPSSLCSMWTYNGTEEEAWQEANSGSFSDVPNEVVKLHDRYVKEMPSSIILTSMAASIHNFHCVESSNWSMCLRLTYQHFRLLNSLESRGIQWLTGSTCVERSALLSCEDDHKCLVHVTNTDWWSTFCRAPKV